MNSAFKKQPKFGLVTTVDAKFILGIMRAYPSLARVDEGLYYGIRLCYHCIYMDYSWGKTLHIYLVYNYFIVLGKRLKSV